MPRLDRERAWRLSLLLGILLLIAVYLWWREHPQAELPPPGTTQAITRTTVAPSLDLAMSSTCAFRATRRKAGR